MNKFLQNLSLLKMEDKFKGVKEKFMGFVNEHPEMFCLSLLAVACLIFLFFGLGAYPLIDVDETRYAVMARDMLHAHNLNNLMLNGVPFLEKPPLYFWFVAASIKLFGAFNPFTVRFPIALLSAALIFFTYYVGKRIISRKFGVISALVLLSSIFFLILAHIAIIDMVLTVFMTGSLYCFLLTHFCEEKNKKYYWWLFYIVAAFGFLAKGLLALAIPGVIILIYNMLTKTVKDIFKPVNLIPGVIVFLAIMLPWHILMYKEYNYEFIKMYILLHHFARFINSETIGRERPLWYFVPVFLLGFMPWTFIFIGVVFDGIKKLVLRYKTAQGNFINKLFAVTEANNNEQKLMLFATLAFVIIFAVFSSSSTKLPTYILPAFPFAALITGYYWWVAAVRGEHKKTIFRSTVILASIFFIAAIGFFIAFNFLSSELQIKMIGFKYYAIVGLALVAMLMVFRLKSNKTLSIFSGYIVTMMFIMILSSLHIFNFVYSTGENEIVQYSEYGAAFGEKAKMVTFDFAVKPSVMIKYPARIDFITDPDFNALDEVLEYQNGPTFVIVKNKNMENNDEYNANIAKRLQLVEKGERYSLYTKTVLNK